MRTKNQRAVKAYIENKFSHSQSLLSRCIREQVRLEEEKRLYKDEIRLHNLPLYQLIEYYEDLNGEKSDQIESLQIDLEARSARNLSEIRINPLELEILKNDFGIDMTEHQVKTVITEVLRHPSKYSLLFYESDFMKKKEESLATASV